MPEKRDPDRLRAMTEGSPSAVRTPSDAAATPSPASAEAHGPAFDPAHTRASLLLRLRADGPAREVAWSEFYACYGPVIARYAQRSGATTAEAEDVVQEVMTSFYGIQPRFEYVPQRGRFRHFLKVCARNATVSRLRKRRREDAGATVPADEIADGHAADESGPDAVWEELWEAEQLKQAIDATQRRYSTNEPRRRTFKAFELYVLTGVEASQVAERLGISLDSVHAAKVRVTRALREELKALQDEQG